MGKVKAKMDAIDAAAWGAVAWAVVKMGRPLVEALIAAGRPHDVGKGSGHPRVTAEQSALNDRSRRVKAGPFRASCGCLAPQDWHGPVPADWREMHDPDCPVRAA